MIEAYAAGFFDGEGCVQAYQYASGLELRLSIANTDIRPLLKIKNNWGGEVENVTRKGNRRDQWNWRVGRVIGEEFARDILPFSIAKKEQLEMFLELCDLHHTRPLTGQLGRPYSARVHRRRKTLVCQISKAKRLPG